MMKMILVTKKVSNLDDMNEVLAQVASIPEVGNYIKNHKLVNRQMFKNECYEIRFTSHNTEVYLSKKFIAA